MDELFTTNLNQFHINNNNNDNSLYFPYWVLQECTGPPANSVEWKIWKGRTQCFNYSGQVLFRFCDSGIWRWIGRPDCSSISFSSSTESELHKDPASVLNFVVDVQWKTARCRIHLRLVMVRYGLAKVLRGVKALQTGETPLMVLKTYTCKDLQAILKFLRYTLLLFDLISSTYGRIKLKISLNL